MKKIIAMVLAAVMLCSLAAAEEAGDTPDFRTLAGLDKMEQKLNAGVTIDRIYYTDGYGFSTSEFTTTDPDEIRSLWDALNQITVKGRSEESITDWYPQIVFTFSDGSDAHVTFESHWLSLPEPWPQANYELENDEAFWSLTAELVKKHEKDTAQGIDSNWNLPETIEMTETVTELFTRAMNGLVGVHYEPLGYLGEKEGVYCILCRATVVYPGATPFYALVYVNEGGLQNIWDLWMDKHANP